MKSMYVSTSLIYNFAHQSLLYIEDLLAHRFAYSQCLSSTSQPQLHTPD